MRYPRRQRLTAPFALPWRSSLWGSRAVHICYNGTCPPTVARLSGSLSCGGPLFSVRIGCSSRLSSPRAVLLLSAHVDDDVPAKNCLLRRLAKSISPKTSSHFWPAARTVTAADKQESGLNLRSKAGALAGGDNGKVILPGKSDKSRLVVAVAPSTRN